MPAFRRLAACTLLALTLAGAQRAVPPALPSQPLSETALSRVAAVRVVRPGVVVPGTPKELNASITVRYGPARPRAVLLLMPGYLGGAGSFDRLARHIVALDGEVAVWAVDRRSNLLEPQAELAKAKPSELARIVQRGLPVRPPSSVGYMKDWGLDVTLRDWRVAVLEARQLTPHVFLGGHSMGASLSGLYAAYDFAGQPGAAEVRGLIMLDGLPGLLADRAITPEQYEQRGGLNVLGPLLGLADLSRQPYVSSPVFGPALASRAAAQARLAAVTPDALAPAGGLTPYPATNLAAGLLQLERRYALLPFLSLQTGHPTNAVEAPSLAALALGGQDSHWLIGPDDRRKPVGWAPDPAAPTDAHDFVRRFWTPLSDYSEWYFPNRLPLDLAAARLNTRGTPFEKGLKVWHTPTLSLPVLGIAAQEGVVTEGAFRSYAAGTRTRLSTRTLAGASHLDLIAARSDQVARWVLNWMRPLRSQSLPKSIAADISTLR